ncbi:ferrochelatase [Bdellovibrio svalbardensis]|uniref:Ferrochelatase n=1 Tax=Bdellovibrio svalbardensis TaxID=2972972 RepID=A0ABT6DEP1_9BACT|nr:ferrochelatase [Bdellovibrio svalbardensis]MDG0815302.1 ferrochelatase [Bdellovibrio svalbardensis]
MAKTGVILFNIGTPRSYEVNDVKEYLLDFLMDKDVINLPFIIRWPLVHGIIVPRRAPFSAENYRKVWMSEGSPLWVYSKHFAEKLQTEMGADYSIKLGMRYSEPSIETSLKEFAAKKVDSIILVPMFPQYADATTGSMLKEFERVRKKHGIQIPTKTLRDFYQDDSFIQPSVEILEESLESKKIDHYLFSFHGLPESHIRRNEGCLRSEDCCFEKSACEKPCYRAQCFATATKIAESLNLQSSHWSVSFQSRLGRAEWLKPSTEHSLEVLAKTDKKNVAVICPSFVADCIETLEEIAMGGAETFKHAGGDNLYVIPCVNEDDRWVKGFASKLKEI